MILVYAYAGNLTSMLAKPSLLSPIRTLEGLVSQHEVPWVIEKGGLAEYLMSQVATGSVMKRMFERGTTMPSIVGSSELCYTTEVKKDGTFAAVCHLPSVKALISKDFSNTGKCNYYIVEESFLHSRGALGIQVKDIFMIYDTAT